MDINNQKNLFGYSNLIEENEFTNQLYFRKTIIFFYNCCIERVNISRKEKGLKKSQVIRDSELSEVYSYQIFSGLRVPERKKLLCLAVGMSLNLDEVQTLLKCAGYSPLYVRLPFDSIIIYGICKSLSVVQINEILFGYDLETLG